MEPAPADAPGSLSAATATTLPDETTTPDSPTGITGVSGVFGVITTPTATMAVVTTSPALPAVDVAKRQTGWRVALARVFGWPVGSVGALLAAIVLLLGPLAACASLVWAVVVGGQGIAAAIGIVHARHYSLLAAPFGLFDLASRVLFASVAYFALLYALVVLMGGLLGRRWARLFLLAGLVFTAVALLAYLASLLLLAAPAQALGIPPVAMAAGALYSLLDVIVLAAVLCDLRPQSAAPAKPTKKEKQPSNGAVANKE